MKRSVQVKAGRRAARRSGSWTARLFLVLLAVFLVSGGLLLRNLLRASQERNDYKILAEQVHRAEEALVKAGEEDPPAEDGVLPQYKALWEENQDLAGWLSIEGTAVDYPVMHTPEDEEYYLRRAFDRSSSVSGTPFLADAATFIDYGPKMGVTKCYTMHKEVPPTEEERAAGRRRIQETAVKCLIDQGIW